MERSRRRRRSDRAGRAPMRSPGRPPVARREDRQRFWAAIADGFSSEQAGVAAGVSPAVGVRWFRDGGGMPSISQAPLSGRYLSFAEREEIAILKAKPPIPIDPPCFFNTGCCSFGDGDITGLELADGEIRLVRWSC